MKEKILSIFIFAFLLIIIGMTSVNAASCGISVSAPAEVKVGDSVTVRVSFTTPIPGAQLNLNYNNSVVQYQSDTLNGSNLGNRIEVIHADYVNMSTISSITFNFTAIAEGTANFSVSSAKLSDDMGEKIPITSNTSDSTKIVVEKPSGGEENPPSQPEQPSQPSQPEQPSQPSQPTEPTFRSDNSTVYTTTAVNVRSSCSTENRNNILGLLKQGEEIKRTGISTDNAWDRVTYKGRVAYIRHGYLTTEKPDETDENNTVNETPADDNVIGNVVDNNVVDENTAIENTNVNEENAIPEDNNAIASATNVKNKKDGKLIAIVISAAAIVVVGIIMFIIYKKVNDEDEDDEEEEEEKQQIKRLLEKNNNQKEEG